MSYICVVSIPQIVVTQANLSGMVEVDGLDYITEIIANRDA